MHIQQCSSDMQQCNFLVLYQPPTSEYCGDFPPLTAIEEVTLWCSIVDHTHSYSIERPNLEMCDDSTAVEIYDHVEWIQRIIMHPDGKRCITVSANQVKMFSLETPKNQVDFHGIEFDIRAASLFDDETLMAYTSDRSASDAEIVFWSLSNGAISFRWNKRKIKYVLNSDPISIAAMGPNQIMVMGNKYKRGATSGKAIAYVFKKRSSKVPTFDSATLPVVPTSNSFRRSYAICSHGNRFVVNAWFRTIQVWAWESDEFQCIKELKVGFSAQSVALSDKHFVCSDRSETIFIYSSSTMELIRTFTSPLLIGDLAAICNNKLLIRGGEDDAKSVALLDIECGVMLWKATFPNSITCCQLSISREFGAQVIVGTKKCKIFKNSLPPDLFLKLTQSDCSVLPPLQNALSLCLAGEASPAECCDYLVTFSACSVSFPEWCSAHQLLVLALRNGEIDESTEYKGSIAHWFKNLYLAVKNLDLTSNEDLVIAERYLREAKRMGLIEGIESVLAALHVAGQAREEVRALHRAGILIFERVMRIEKRFDMLKESCEQYRRHQMYSQCIGIALQIIPIVGGASAGVISAGANIVEGLSIKDVADYAFGLGSSLTEGEMPSFGDRVFRRAAEVLSPECVAKMQEEELRLVEEAVSACELSLEELRRLFIERAKEDCETGADEVIELKEEPHSLDGNVLLVDDVLESHKNNTACRDDAERCKLVQEPVPDVSNSDMLVGKTKRGKESGYTMEQKPSELKTCEVKKDSIASMTQIEIAALCAAFVVRFDDGWVDMFVAFRDRIMRVFEENHLDGAVIVDRKALSASELVDAVLDGLKEDGKGSVTIGVKGKVRQFFNMIG